MTPFSELAALFAALPAPQPGDDVNPIFSAATIPYSSAHRVGKDADGNPCVLIRTRDPSRDPQCPPVKLEHLSVSNKVLCKVTAPSGRTEQSTCIVIRCDSRDVDLREYFFWVLGELLRGLGEDPSPHEISSAIDRLVELFRALTRPAQSSVQGLWSELLVIAEAPQPLAAVKAWHTAPEERYDFYSDTARLEVKSAASGVRSHHFSLEQLHPPANARALVASLLVTRATVGANVFDLAERITGRIGGESRAIQRLQQIMSATLSDGWRTAADIRFDRESAISSIRFFNVTDIPSVEVPTPEAVTSVTFRADLTHAASVDLAGWLTRDSLFTALIAPR